MQLMVIVLLLVMLKMSLLVIIIVVFDGTDYAGGDRPLRGQKIRSWKSDS